MLTYMDVDQSKINNNNNNGTTTNNSNGGGGVGMGGKLETSRSDRKVWLMKCPPMVSRSLHSPLSSSSSPGGGPSAKVIVTIDPLLPSDIDTQFTMELAGTESGNVPKVYSMDMSTDFVPMSVFAESSQGKLSVEGKIYHKFDMKPHNENIEDYGRLCRERTNKYSTKSRQIQVISHENGLPVRPLLFVDTKNNVLNDKKKVQTKGSDMKRTRKDRGEVEEIMFKLFERQSNWTLKQLLHETNQPEQFLKDILKHLCFYNNKGANNGSYELKPEYRKFTEELESE